MGKRRWTLAELNLIASGQHTVYSLSKMFECTEKTIREAIIRYEIDFDTANYRFWTKSEIETLTKMRSEGATLAEIATALKRPITTVTAKARDCGLSKKKGTAWTKEDDILLKELRDCGYKFDFIASIFNKSKDSCSMRYYRLTGRVK